MSHDDTTLPDRDDPTIVRLRAALDEAASVTPATAAPVERPAMGRGRWMAIAAAAVLVVGGVAAVAVNLRGDGDAAVTNGTAVSPDTVLTGVATIIDEGTGAGPMLASTVLASLPPQGGDIPLANFDWDLVEGEQTMGATTWSEPVQVTGRWDGTRFTIDRPTTTPPSVSPPPVDLTPTAGCDRATAQAAADAVAALDWKALHLSTWNPITTGGKCGAEVTAWFLTQELREAVDTVRAAGHEVTVTFLFNPVADPTPPSTVTTTAPTTTVASGGEGDWYEITAPGLTARPVEFTGCCLPFPAAGPDVVMVWTDNAGGVFVLQASAHADGSPADLTFASHGLTPARAKELEGRVVPGSGLPYVLDDPAMELIGQGLDGAGNTTSQRYIATSGNGDALLTVGDYTGQLGALAGPWQVDDTTVAGQAAVRYATNAFTVFVWQTPQRQWAELKLAAALADRADEIAASLVAIAAPQNPAVIDTSVPSTASPATSTSAATASVDIPSWSHEVPTFDALIALPTYDSNATDSAVGTQAPAFADASGAPVVGVTTDEPTLVVFTARWCPHCARALPGLFAAEVDGRLGAVRVVVVETAASTTIAQAYEHGDYARWGHADPVYVDPSSDTTAGPLARAYGAAGFPFFVLVDTDGKVLRRTMGETTIEDLTRFVAG